MNKAPISSPYSRYRDEISQISSQKVAMHDSILQGDALTVLKTLPERSMQCCITSPPYYLLRDYGVPGQIGLEETPEAYISRLVEVFREVRRVLRDDGTLWVNIADSYVGGNYRGGGSENASAKQRSNVGTLDFMASKQFIPKGYKPKDLYGIPWMLAFALRTDGWYLRSDVIWHKPNCMPESVRDRPTKSHEYLFLLSKSQKYFYDAGAIREPVSSIDRRGSRRIAYKGKGNPTSRAFSGGATRLGQREDGLRNRRSVWHINTKSYAGTHFAVMPSRLAELCLLSGTQPGDCVLDPFLGAGTVAVIAQQHYRHYLGIELNPDYIALASRRLTQQLSLLAL